MKERSPGPARRWLLAGLLSALAFVASAHAARPSLAGPGALGVRGDAYETTLQYLTTFYPLWFTYNQSNHGPANRLVGPDRMSPQFLEVVAPNDDTLYVSSFLDLTGEPLILTIPETQATWSLLTVDYFGTAFQTGIPQGESGTYALVGPDWTGGLPAGAIPIQVPVEHAFFIIRADKYSNTGEHQLAAAEQFRASLRLTTVTGWQADPSSGTPAIVPVALYAQPYKSIANGLIARDPLKFLQQLQTAVESAKTPALSPAARQLADQFNQLLQDGDSQGQIGAGARAAHRAIVASYLRHKGATHWVTYNNIANWGDDVLARAATTEYLQLSNLRSTAAYFHAFEDGRGAPLRGSAGRGYVLTFPADQIPQAKRFWSVTVYSPNTITLVKNSAGKYLVARYTPRLVTNSDGSISIYMAARKPRRVPEANWLPIPRGPFNVVLRVYGPEGSVADQTYVPPAIQRLRSK